MRVYNSCNYNFTVLPIFTIEEENKEAQPYWYAESWELIKSFATSGCQIIWNPVPALPVIGSMILGKALLSFSISPPVQSK